MPDQAIQILSELFPRLSAEAVQSIIRSGQRMVHPAQVTICDEGKVEDCFYVVLSGRVDVYKVLEGQRLLVNSLNAGTHFGDIALLLDQPRSASIVTAERTEILSIDRSTFNQLIHANADILVALSQMVIRRFLLQEEKQLTEIARLKKKDSAPAKVFLSYASGDREFATRLSNNLLKYNVDLWLDIYRVDPGKSWARQIGEALDTCEVMLLILSPTSVASENVEDEWNYFLDRKKPAVSILLEPCKVPYRLSKLHYIDFHTSDFDQAVARVVATLNTIQ